MLASDFSPAPLVVGWSLDKSELWAKEINDAKLATSKQEAEAEWERDSLTQVQQASGEIESDIANVTQRPAQMQQ